MRYVLAFHAEEPGISTEEQPSAEEMAEMQQLMTDFTDSLEAAGVMVAAEMLTPGAVANAHF